jgi:multifunctional methyltransferase subunit TRM112
MRLLTHNALRSYGKEIAEGYPLAITIEDMEVDESEPNEEFIARTLPTLNWHGIKVAAAAVGFDGLPEVFDVKHLEDKDFVKVIHKLLLDIHVLKGTLTCPESGRVYPIVDGIARMNISEAEA